jgi:hypothetical protein
VLAGAVDAGERLLVEQRRHVVLERHRLERLHRQHVGVGGVRREREDRRELVLRGRHLVVQHAERHAERPEAVAHLVQHAARARIGARKVLVGALLAAERQRAEERAADNAEVGPALEERAVDEEELLLPADVGDDVAHVGVAERVEKARRLAVERGVGAQQRRLVVERVAVPRDEDRGQIERLVDNKGRRRQCHALKAAAVCVARRPPCGNDEPSVSD